MKGRLTSFEAGGGTVFVCDYSRVAFRTIVTYGGESEPVFPSFVVLDIIYGYDLLFSFSFSWNSILV